MKRLTTAYERKWADGRTETGYAANASDLEVVSRLGAYEDAEEERRLFVTPCKPGDLIYEVDVIERPEWDCYVNGFVVQDVSAKQSQVFRRMGRLGYTWCVYKRKRSGGKSKTVKKPKKMFGIRMDPGDRETAGK